VDTGGYADTVGEAAEFAVAGERAGFDACWAVETKVDALTACAIAAERTERIDVGTSIAVAFARNPMTVAVTANDLQSVSGGRFVLGMGTQIKPHITKRFSMPWSHPAARMREFVLAIRAIWDAWDTGERLNFRGEFYQHTLSTPFFTPPPNPHGHPPIYLAAVGPLMTETAGEVADGMFCHGFTTERFVREVTMPAVERGLAKSGRARSDFTVAGQLFAAIGDSERERACQVAEIRRQIAFYGSTPAYRPVLELHGWGELGDELNALTKRGKWDDISELVTDEVLDTFAIIGTAEDAVAELNRRYGDVLGRAMLPALGGLEPERFDAVVGDLRAG
jgi:probable F420-dependent oxidoreductase